MQSKPPTIAVLMTLDSKPDVARFFCSALQDAGASPWLVDLSLRAHENSIEGHPTQSPLDSGQTTLAALQGLSRADAAQLMTEAATALVTQAYEDGRLSAAIGVGGANGSTMACGVMRELPAAVPKVMVTPVAATAAVQWYVAQSDIAMFPTIGDISLNRITRAVLENAAQAISAMGQAAMRPPRGPANIPPLIGVSTFGNLQVTVDSITASLERLGCEVIQFHASGAGGRALESLVRAGELRGLIDLTTSELTDHVVGGVYSAGPDRMKAAADVGLPQVIVPGCLDFANWWFGEVPERYRTREFFRYNQEILLMRTNEAEFAELGRLFVKRLVGAAGPYKILIPELGFSQMTDKATQNAEGKEVGRWHQPDCDLVFAQHLEGALPAACIERLNLHINDPAFAHHTVASLAAMLPELSRNEEG